MPASDGILMKLDWFDGSAFQHVADMNAVNPNFTRAAVDVTTQRHTDEVTGVVHRRFIPGTLSYEITGSAIAHSNGPLLNWIADSVFGNVADVRLRITIPTWDIVIVDRFFVSSWDLSGAMDEGVPFNITLTPSAASTSNQTPNIT